MKYLPFNRTSLRHYGVLLIDMHCYFPELLMSAENISHYETAAICESQFLQENRMVL